MLLDPLPLSPYRHPIIDPFIAFYLTFLVPRCCLILHYYVWLSLFSHLMSQVVFKGSELSFLSGLYPKPRQSSTPNYSVYTSLAGFCRDVTAETPCSYLVIPQGDSDTADQSVLLTPCPTCQHPQRTSLCPHHTVVPCPSIRRRLQSCLPGQLAITFHCSVSVVGFPS